MVGLSSGVGMCARPRVLPMLQLRLEVVDQMLTYALNNLGEQLWSDDQHRASGHGDVRKVVG